MAGTCISVYWSLKFVKFVKTARKHNRSVEDFREDIVPRVLDILYVHLVLNKLARSFIGLCVCPKDQHDEQPMIEGTRIKIYFYRFLLFTIDRALCEPFVMVPRPYVPCLTSHSCAEVIQACPSNVT